MNNYDERGEVEEKIAVKYAQDKKGGQKCTSRKEHK